MKTRDMKAVVSLLRKTAKTETVDRLNALPESDPIFYEVLALLLYPRRKFSRLFLYLGAFAGYGAALIQVLFSYLPK